jgi:hypothetical protein
LEVRALLKALKHSFDFSDLYFPSIWPEIFPEVEAAVQGIATVALKALLICLALAPYLLSLKGCCREGCRGVSISNQVGLISKDLCYLEAIRNNGFKLNFWGHDGFGLDSVEPGLGEERSDFLDSL